MTPANDRPYTLDVDQLEAELATLTDADLRTAAVNAPLEGRADEIIDGEAERRGIDL